MVFTNFNWFPHWKAKGVFISNEKRSFNSSRVFRAWLNQFCAAFNGSAKSELDNKPKVILSAIASVAETNEYQSSKGYLQHFHFCETIYSLFPILAFFFSISSRDRYANEDRVLFLCNISPCQCKLTPWIRTKFGSPFFVAFPADRGGLAYFSASACNSRHPCSRRSAKMCRVAIRNSLARTFDHFAAQWNYERR